MGKPTEKSINNDPPTRGRERLENLCVKLIVALGCALEFLEANDDGEGDVTARIATAHSALSLAAGFPLQSKEEPAVYPPDPARPISLEDILRSVHSFWDGGEEHWKNGKRANLRATLDAAGVKYVD